MVINKDFHAISNTIVMSKFKNKESIGVAFLKDDFNH
jgi:hypothetical protein